MNKFWNAPAWTMGKLYGRKNKKQDDGNTPGPGNYNSSLGNRGLSGTKFGNSKRIGLNSNATPGPGSYNVSNAAKGPKVSFSGKNGLNANNDTNFTPGPGNYNPNCDVLYKSQSGITMGFRNNDDKNVMNNPGPGQYNTASVDQIKIGGKIGTSKRSNFGGNAYVPGPGNYNPQSRPYSAGPKYGFTREIKSTFGVNNDPGPGQYQTKGFLDSQGKNGITMGYRNEKTEGVDISNTPGPGSYYNDFGAKRSSSGAKIGKAQRGNKFGGYGPGPGAYDQGFRAKIGPSAKFGSSKRQGFGRAQTPGPGAYDSNLNKQSGITISGYKAKQNIELTPGPGSYNPDYEDMKSRPCSAKIGKGLRSQQASVFDTPGPGQYYNQRPTNPKFAFTKEVRSKDAKGGDPGPGQYEIPSSVPSAPYYVLDPSIYQGGSRKI